MAFSQKHTGKVFVPWFSTEEWRNVYQMIISNSVEAMENALEIIKIWKIRTPLLSAGVEGTLILLEALLQNTINMTDSQIVYIYSTMLLRFLNICAANSNRQGNFNNIMSRSELPKWIIDIRHDIAHGNKLPSRDILELAIGASFKWVIDKYWKKQDETISDYVVTTESKNTKVLDTLNVYVRLNLNLFNKLDMNKYDEALMEKVNYLVSKRFNKSKTDIQGLLVILEEILRQTLAIPENKLVANKFAEILVNENGIIATSLEITEEGDEFIPEEFRKIWLNLLNILFESEGFIVALLDQLFEVTNNSPFEFVQKLASVWIEDILTGLLRVKFLKEELNSSQKILSDNHLNLLNLQAKLEKRHPEYKNCIQFHSIDKLSQINLKKFEEKVFLNSNIHTVNFFDKLARFNENPDAHQRIEFIKCRHGLMKLPDLKMDVSDIYELPDINLETNKLSLKNERLEVPNSTTEIPSKRWKLIEDTSSYKDCPLGVLPHQKPTYKI